VPYRPIVVLVQEVPASGQVLCIGVLRGRQVNVVFKGRAGNVPYRPFVVLVQEVPASGQVLCIAVLRGRHGLK
jgi:hypothetical protein